MSLIDQAKEQMAKTVENTKENFSGIRTGRANPALLNGSRRARIARGAGLQPSDVNKLMKQYQQMEKMMSKLSGGGMKGLMRGVVLSIVAWLGVIFTMFMIDRWGAAQDDRSDPVDRRRSAGRHRRPRQLRASGGAGGRTASYSGS